MPEKREAYLEKKRILNLEDDDQGTLTQSTFAEEESAPSTGNLYSDLAVKNTPAPLRNDAGVYLYIPFSEEVYRSPEIWFLNLDATWEKVGGKITKTQEEKAVLSAKVEKTGTYGVFDSYPYPILSRGVVPEPIGETQTDSPYPSVEARQEEVTNESEMVLDEGMFEIQTDVSDIPLEAAVTTKPMEAAIDYNQGSSSNFATISEPLDLSTYSLYANSESVEIAPKKVFEDPSNVAPTDEFVSNNSLPSIERFEIPSISSEPYYDVYSIDDQGIPSFESAENLITPETIQDNSYSSSIQNNITQSDKNSFPIFLVLSVFLVIGGSILIRRELEHG